MAMLLLLFAVVSGSRFPECKPQFAPLDTGSHSGASRLDFWRKEEAGGWGGKGWLGWTDKSDTLLPVQLVVRERPKDVLNEEDEVTVQSVPEVNFAARCVPELRAGKIRSAGMTNHDLHYDGPLEISLGNRRYDLRVEAKDPSLAETHQDHET